ncbi:MAG: B12-binding domain-containing radical SAM protein, partial [Candidatus Omnitrophica bacterium]|nr:B12-binding domain-containing radical SAM protein [Candidatus Omnitrophota bacterium]
NSEIKIVLSGIHPSALPEKTLREERADYIAYGEGFYTILQLLKMLKGESCSKIDDIEGLFYRKNGEIVANKPAKLIKDIDSFPFVAWDLLPMEKYRAHNWHCFENIEKRSPYAAIYTSFGCPYHCSYCNIHAIYNQTPGIRYRSCEKVVEEIGLLVEKYNIRHLKIADELFVLNKKRVEKICNLIIEKGYKLNIWAYARIDTVDENILKKLKQAGVNWLCYGIESANEDVRKGVSKKIQQNKIEEVIKMTKDAGIYILGNFIFGLPDDNLETMEETLKMAERLNCEYVNFYVAMAYPGSNLYYEAIKKGIKLPYRWDGYAQLSSETLPMPTKYLKGEEVLKFRDEAFVRYFSREEYLNMINKKFGNKVVQHIKQMLENKIERKYIR